MRGGFKTSRRRAPLPHRYPRPAALLFSFNVGQGGDQPGVTGTLTYRVSSDNGYATLFFENTTWSTADTGKTVTLARASDPVVFDAFTSPAVNFSGQGWTESEIVFGANTAAAPFLAALVLRHKR
jgi:hypothetical protein